MDPADERRHLFGGPRPGERFGGFDIESVVAICEGDAAEVLARCREVLAVVLDRQTGPWPEPAEWRRLLPAWFVDACAEEMTDEQAEQWLGWWQSLPPEQQDEVSRARPWSLNNWLGWLEPGERQWFWWNAEVESPDRLRVEVEVLDWGAPLGALKWLLRAAGAREVVEAGPRSAGGGGADRRR